MEDIKIEQLTALEPDKIYVLKVKKSEQEQYAKYLNNLHNYLRAIIILINEDAEFVNLPEGYEVVKKQ